MSEFKVRWKNTLGSEIVCSPVEDVLNINQSKKFL
jgi:hypothetical protein